MFSVGADLSAKAAYQPRQLCRMYLPLRGQVPSHWIGAHVRFLIVPTLRVVTHAGTLRVL
jgi:hypothetical protein